MKYLFKALIILILALAALFAAKELGNVALNVVHISLLAFVMFATSMLVHHFTIKASEENPKRFPAYFMAITGLKMMVYIILLELYVFLFKDNAIPIVIAFLLLYLAYTTLEVISAVSELKK